MIFLAKTPLEYNRAHTEMVDSESPSMMKIQPICLELGGLSKLGTTPGGGGMAGPFSRASCFSRGSALKILSIVLWLLRLRDLAATERLWLCEFYQCRGGVGDVDQVRLQHTGHASVTEN